MVMKKMYCIKYNKYKKFPKISHIFDKTLVLSIISYTYDPGQFIQLIY